MRAEKYLKCGGGLWKTILPFVLCTNQIIQHKSSKYLGATAPPSALHLHWKSAAKEESELNPIRLHHSFSANLFDWPAQIIYDGGHSPIADDMMAIVPSHASCHHQIIHGAQMYNWRGTGWVQCVRQVSRIKNHTFRVHLITSYQRIWQKIVPMIIMMMIEMNELLWSVW